MTRRLTISSDSPFEAQVGFSRAVRLGDRVLVSGTAPIWQDGSCDPDPGAQARRCLEIIVTALGEAGAAAADVVRTRIFITDAADAQAVGRAHADVFGDGAAGGDDGRRRRAPRPALEGRDRGRGRARLARLAALAPVAVEAGPLLLGRHGLQKRLRGLRVGMLDDLAAEQLLERRRVEPPRPLGLLAEAAADGVEVGVGSAIAPKWVRPRLLGPQSSIRSIEASQASRSMSGGGVGGMTKLDGSMRTAATSPTKARPLSSSR